PLVRRDLVSNRTGDRVKHRGHGRAAYLLSVPTTRVLNERRCRVAAVFWPWEIIEHEHEIQNPLSPEKIRRLGDYLGLTRASRVLDVACGKGGPARILALFIGRTTRARARSPRRGCGPRLVRTRRRRRPRRAAPGSSSASRD